MSQGAKMRKGRVGARMRRLPIWPIAFLAVLLTLPLASSAQTLREAVVLGSQRDPTIAALREQVAAETSNVEISRDARRPQLNISGDTGDNGGDLGINLTVTQLLADWGLSKSQIAEAEAERVKVVAMLKSEVEDFTLAMSEAYFEIVIAKAKIARTQEYVRFTNRQERYSRDRVRAGLANSAEVARARLEISRAEEELFQHRMDYDIALAEAEFLLGQPLKQVSPPPALAFLDRLKSSREVITAVVGAPDYVSASADVAIARAGVSAARASRKPQLKLEATVRQDLTGGRGRSSAVGITAGMDLTSSGFRGRAVIAAEQRMKAADQRLRAVEKNLQNEVRTYRQRLEALRVSKRSLQAQVSDARDVLRAFEEQFRAGQRELQDLLSTGRDLYEAEISAIDTADELNRMEYKAAQSVGLLGAMLLSTKREK